MDQGTEPATKKQKCDDNADFLKPGELFITNNLLQFVRLHGQVGDRFQIVEDGLKKLPNEDNLQKLTITGNFSFSFNKD